MTSMNFAVMHLMVRSDFLSTLVDSLMTNFLKSLPTINARSSVYFRAMVSTACATI